MAKIVPKILDVTHLGQAKAFSDKHRNGFIRVWFVSGLEMDIPRAQFDYYRFNLEIDDTFQKTVRIEYGEPPRNNILSLHRR